MGRVIGQPPTAPRNEKLFCLPEKPHPPVNVAPPLWPFHALHSSALVTVRSRVFFIVLKEVIWYGSTKA